MALKKTKKRRAKVKKHLAVFVLTLSVVLFAGMAAILGCMAVIRNSGTDRKQESGQDTVVEFQWHNEPSGTAVEDGESYPVAEHNMQETADTPQTPEPPEDLRPESERLYAEAVEKGENVKLVECADSGHAVFAFAGDVLLDDEYAMMFGYRNRGNDVNAIFLNGLLERMRDADVFMLNNEFPFSDRGVPLEGKKFTFRAKPSNVELFEQMGVDIVSLANNHAYDHGEEALLDTFTTLENAGISYVGAGRNINEAKKPMYFIANGVKIAVVSATQIERISAPDTKEATAENAGVLRCMDPAALLGVIAEAKESSDFVVLYIHWGTESQEETDWLQDQQAPQYAEAGVDLIIGDHPHCLQKIDVVSGVPVVYSLGNFWFNSRTMDTCLVEAGISQEGLDYLQFIPCRQEDCSTRLLDGDDKAGVLEYMRGLSPGVRIDDEGYILLE